MYLSWKTHKSISHKRLRWNWRGRIARVVMHPSPSLWSMHKTSTVYYNRLALSHPQSKWELDTQSQSFVYSLKVTSMHNANSRVVWDYTFSHGLRLLFIILLGVYSELNFFFFFFPSFGIIIEIFFFFTILAFCIVSWGNIFNKGFCEFILNPVIF